MAFNFPDSPTLNQVYQFYTWDGEKWISTIGGTAGVSVWTPLNLVGLKGWWDASVTASLTLSGSNITAVADQSGAGTTLTTFGSSPTYNATGLNSLPTMSFSGTGQGLQNLSVAFGTGNTLTVFGVVIMNSGTGAYGRLFSYKAGGTSDADNNVSFLISRDNTTNAMVLYRNTIQASRAVSTGVPVRVIATINSSGVETIYVNGVSTTGSTLNAAFASGALAIGGAVQDGTSRWNGQASELGIATGFADTTTVASLDLYLKNKWGPFWTITYLRTTFDGTSTGLSGLNIRQVIGPASLSFSGSKVRVTLLSASGLGGSATIDHVSIGHAASSGDPYDFDGGQIELTFSGSTGCTIATGSSITSDAMTFSFDKTKSFIVAVHYSGTSATQYVAPTASEQGYYKAAASEVLVANVSGYTTGVSYLVYSIEVSV